MGLGTRNGFERSLGGFYGEEEVEIRFGGVRTGIGRGGETWQSV